ncbi:tRNA (guanine(9)-N(1))-methyltransferase [Blyttiomyces sp. JEL0837]|nr:tRNA (guanine(9)-N(1))-methyltransferase [Blyttiomyces sp. JEL0837]
MKRQKKLAEQEANKAQWKQQLKDKRKQKKAEIKQQKALGIWKPPIEHQARVRKEDQVLSNMRIVLDCDFESYMNLKEVQSVSTQIGRCYSVNNRGCKHPVNLVVTGMGEGLTKSMVERHPEWNRWKMTFEEKSYMDLYSKDEMIYLSADSENLLETLDESKVYIIGGIVDKNRHKNLCQQRATAAGIKTARLPITEFLAMETRKVLTINQVFEIMVKYLDNRDWKDAFTTAIPSRKNFVVKDGVEGTSAEADGEGQDGQDGQSDNDDHEDGDEKEDDE